ncbi:DUF3164 family protein [Ectopseudomonas oleovorans]|uniref:DUF3164 family protein n=1 Tax=Ectopseudomonas oleovorans TaxID=301 RepID=UPI003F1D82E0
MTAQQPIPAGYRQDAQGRLIPESMIKPIDVERDRLVRHLIDRASELNSQLADFKAAAFGDVRAFIEMSFEEYGAKFGGAGEATSRCSASMVATSCRLRYRTPSASTSACRPPAP